MTRRLERIAECVFGACLMLNRTMMPAPSSRCDAIEATAQASADQAAALITASNQQRVRLEGTWIRPEKGGRALVTGGGQPSRLFWRKKQLVPRFALC